MKGKMRYSPTICLTHDCNLNCVYCYQHHTADNKMSLETAKKCVDEICTHTPENTDGIALSFIGGEPLLEFDMIKSIVDYTEKKYPQLDVVYDASTNGTLLTEEMKAWFSERRKRFVLGLSLDGTPEVHNHNRCNSYSMIDFDFFLKNYPNSGVKMTLTDFSLVHLAECIKHIHKLGFKHIVGVNLFEGNFDWSDERYIRILIHQLDELDRFYVEHPELPLNQMLDRFLPILESQNGEPRQWCGIGTGAVFYDIDGERYPCPFCTPMTLDAEKLAEIRKVDFTDKSTWQDDCFAEKCYMYPICPRCTGATYMNTGSTKTRDRSKCRIQKLITLYSADIQGKRILQNPELMKPGSEGYMIKAIENIKKLYLPEFAEYFNTDNAAKAEECMHEYELVNGTCCYDVNAECNPSCGTWCDSPKKPVLRCKKCGQEKPAD